MKRFSARRSSVAALLCTVLALPSPDALLNAQETAPERDVYIEEIVTIGTRVKGRTETQTPVPVDTIDLGTITENGFTELGPMLQAVAPSFNFSRTQISDASDLFRPATLRGLGPDQVLVLVNGKRRHQRSVLSLSGTVGEGASGTDFNAIPAAGIERIEILRDGAAAQYGSDAIAGVINLVLRDFVDGYSLSARIGQTYDSDGEQYQVSANAGFSLGEGGHVNFTAEYRNGEPTNRADVSRQLGDVRFQIGDADTEASMFWVNSALPLGESAELYAFGGYSENVAVGAGFYRFANNPARAVPQAFPEGFLPRALNESKDYSFAAGIRGEPSRDWAYDISAVYGKNDYTLRVRNAPNTSIAAAFLQGNPGTIDAEISANVGPTSGFSGALEFDQLIINADFTTQFDLAAPNTVYVAFGAEYRDDGYEITPGQLESYSCGLNPDNQFVPSILDPNTAATCGFQAYPGFRPETATTGNRDNFALYLDLESDLTDWLILGVAARYADYGAIGDKLTGKASGRVQVSEDLAFRGAISTGFRAPSLQQTFFTTVATNATSAGLTEQLLAPVGSEFPRLFGIENLRIEESTNFSLGLVWKPLAAMTLTFDAFQIDIDDRIVLGSGLAPGQLAAVPAAAQFLANNGIGSANFFSNAVDTRTKGLDLVVSHDGLFLDGDLTTTLALNLNKTTIRRVNAPAGVDEFLLFPEPSRRFVEKGQPRERVNLTFNYMRENWGGLFRLNYFGPTETSFFSAPGLGFPQGAIDAIGLDPSPVIEPGDAFLVDLEVSLQVTETTTLALGANNLLNEKPNQLSDNAVLRFISDPSTPFGNIKFPLRGLAYGLNGGFYYTRLNVNF